jgi:E3 ubiquitin-protein ligase TRIP12
MWRSDDSTGTTPAAKKNDKSKQQVKADHGKAVAQELLPSVSAVQNDLAADEAAQYVVAPQGLFPAPMSTVLRASTTGAKILDKYRLLGRAMAKALQDGRLLDLPLSYVFYRAALGQPLDLYDIRRVDAPVGATLEKLHVAHKAYQHQTTSNRGLASLMPMMVDGCPIEELCLTFELPGYPDYELRQGGSDIAVDASNVGNYIDAVVDATLKTGIQAQLDAFREGFNEVFPLHTLSCFYEDEVEAMLCGTGEKWVVEGLADTIKFDHGYTANSTAIKFFLQVLTELDAADQRRFLRFVTGTPRLPPGGIAALQPRLTVVRKHPSSSSDPALGTSAPSPKSASLGHQSSISPLANGDLPSVMTCANYIKLPPYSTLAIMRERVLFAIREGQGSFDLS